MSTVRTGSAEFPGLGDPDGSASATITVNPGQKGIRDELTVGGLTPASVAQSHEAPPGVAGPVVVGLPPPTSGFSGGCVSVQRRPAKTILENPYNLSPNIRDAGYPARVPRGQSFK